MEVAVSMIGANGQAAASRLALAMRIKVLKEIISETHTAELFVQYLVSQMERHEGCSQDPSQWKEKGRNQVKP